MRWEEIFHHPLLCLSNIELRRKVTYSKINNYFKRERKGRKKSLRSYRKMLLREEFTWDSLMKMSFPVSKCSELELHEIRV